MKATRRDFLKGATGVAVIATGVATICRDSEPTTIAMRHHTTITEGGHVLESIDTVRHFDGRVSKTYRYYYANANNKVFPLAPNGNRIEDWMIV